MTDFAERLLASRSSLYTGDLPGCLPRDGEEGGCGVTGFACTIPVRGKFIYEPSIQMQNRGNGKGGGIAAVGLVPEEVGVPPGVLSSHYLIQIALLDPAAHAEVERQFILPVFDVALSKRIETVADFHDIPGLEVRPPDVHRYLVRVKPDVLRKFAHEAGLQHLAPRDLEDEFVWRNSYRLNDAFYASLGTKRAFVLSHGRDMCVFKLVGYAEQNVQYYKLEDFRAHVWIAHQRYPTKGRVWHPGGAHPFVGLNEALVHNGDFANYHSVGEYLRQRNIRQQFLTDTEVSVQLFDLWDRVYKYPLEYIIEALAPTTELDFDQLPPEKQRVYRQIQATHIHASPDGPWFFIIARSLPDKKQFQLLGITDTAMLRPQVFALQDNGEVQIGLDLLREAGHRRDAAEPGARGPAVLPRGRQVLERPRRQPHRRRRVHLHRGRGRRRARKRLTCTDKFGRPVTLQIGAQRVRRGPRRRLRRLRGRHARRGGRGPAPRRRRGPRGLRPPVAVVAGRRLPPLLPTPSCEAAATGDKARAAAIETPDAAPRPALRHRRQAPQPRVLHVLEESLAKALRRRAALRRRRHGRVPADRLGRRATCWPRRSAAKRSWSSTPRSSRPRATTARPACMRKAYHLGWRRFIVYRLRGQRFNGVGLGPDTDGVRIDLYGSSGDYLASGVDGLDAPRPRQRPGPGRPDHEARQAGHPRRRGPDVHVRRQGRRGLRPGQRRRPAAHQRRGPPARGHQRHVPGLPGRVVHGRRPAATAAASSSSTASSSTPTAASCRRPCRTPAATCSRWPRAGPSTSATRTGRSSSGNSTAASSSDLSDKDWRLIRPYLEENERLFGITVDDLLTVDGEVREPAEVYRKISAVKLQVLAGTEKKK